MSEGIAVGAAHLARARHRRAATDKVPSVIQFNAVVETNTAAVHLWQSLGFGILGTAPESFDHAEHGLVGLHLMYQRL